ncbi:NADH-quinone oxidoreductase subunit 12 [Novipirellula aureliae]|uniref:NADH-quinone oxidoreductase subunit 12 n=1 Tax=Novipirellula aureliae TaxID=2527966 RepID=A0A5C6DFF4_9BACT|nr:proton-conducting transporter membrane subunit [Novipirellula aureliae]TWU34547.1 NADH-quinone oxidoreductase subunit 12 [Novipirellula aureliae]
MTLETSIHFFGVMVVAAPAVLLSMLGLSMLFGIPLSEKSTSRLTQSSVAIGLLAVLSILLLMLWNGDRHLPIEMGNWVSIQEQHFHFHLKFVFDRLSIPFTILTFVLCGTIGAFAKVYLHREPGYNRFFLLYSVFLLGMVVSSLAGTIETLFFGWELVGLSSALLIAYFHERQTPVINGHRVWSVYRIADAAFLVAALTMHHLTGGGDFDGLMGSGPWPEGVASIDPHAALVVGLLLLVAAAGKSGMVPFSGWLPRAMEGPTPSSAVFYGALSVHLGAYMLLRVSPLLDVSFPLRVCVIVMGAASALFGALTARVQTDVKSALAYASLTQVGIIVVEIGFGFHYLALIHIIGHALMRTLQLLRAPSLLKDYHTLEDAIGGHLPQTESIIRSPQRGGSPRLYRFCLERGHLDAMIDRFVVRPFEKTFLWTGEMERRWTRFLSGDRSPQVDQARWEHPSINPEPRETTTQRTATQPITTQKRMSATVLTSGQLSTRENSDA